MKFDSLLKALKSILPTLKKFRYPLVGAIVIAVFAFTVFQIDSLSGTERDKEVYDELLSSVEKIQFNHGTINEILKLKEADVDVQSQLPNDRTNPF